MCAFLFDGVFFFIKSNANDLAYELIKSCQINKNIKAERKLITANVNGAKVVRLKPGSFTGKKTPKYDESFNGIEGEA